MTVYGRFDIVRDIADEIAAGRYGPDHRLPSYRQLMHRYGVSEATVRRAYVELREQGLVRGVRGSGVYVVRAAGRGDERRDG